MDGDIALSPGEIICDGRYEIDSMLGRGGMGVVYKARSLLLKRDVAIKMLTDADDELLHRFSREAALMAQVDHPAVAKIFDFRESGKWGPLIVMEYLQGRDLSKVLKGPMPVAPAVDIILGVCSGVFACHKHKIIHRDIKPRNVFQVPASDWRKRVKVLDFGLAIPHDSPLLQAFQARITQMGSVAGTPRFIAPELIRGEEPDEKCDQYAIALLLYMTLTGRAPFFDLEGKDLLHAIRHGDYLAPQLLRNDLPAELTRILVRALHLDPQKRFASVAELAFALIRFATPKDTDRWTRLFTDASRPIAHELLGPVSAPHASQAEVPPVKEIKPIFDPEPAAAHAIIEQPYSEPPTTVDVRPRASVVTTEYPMAPIARPAPVAQPALHVVTQPEPSEASIPPPWEHAFPRFDSLAESDGRRPEAAAERKADPASLASSSQAAPRAAPLPQRIDRLALRSPEQVDPPTAQPHEWVDRSAMRPSGQRLPLDSRYARHLLTAFALGVLLGTALTIAVFFLLDHRRTAHEQPHVSPQVSAPASK